MTLIWYAIGIITALYAGLMLAYVVGWHKQKEYTPVLSTNPLNQPKVSVVIPLRNEAHNLPTLIPSLQNQTYPNLEVLLVNDHSTDATQSLIFGLNNPLFIPLNSVETSKKAALQYGINHATGALILTTDADVLQEVYQADLLALKDLDKKLWTVLSAPTAGLRFDAACRKRRHRNESEKQKKSRHHRCGTGAFAGPVRFDAFWRKEGSGHSAGQPA